MAVPVVDRLGRMRMRRFGPVSDMVLGAEIMALLLEPATPA